MAQTAEEIKKHVRVDITVLAIFAVLTLVHVVIAQMHVAGAGILVPLLYAARLILVAYYFHYLTQGKSIITITLLLTAFFLGVLILLPMFR